jgi:hypothetical protein
MMIWNDFVMWLTAWWAEWCGWWVSLFGLCLLLVVFTGCSDSKATPEQQTAAQDRQMEWLDKAVEIAKKHDVAYLIEADTGGRPSVGSSVDFYFESDLTARILLFGNGGSDETP